MLKVFNLPFSKWKLLLLAGDLVIFWVSALLGLLFNPMLNEAPWSFLLEHRIPLLGICLTYLTVLYIGNLYDHCQDFRLWSNITGIMVWSLIGTVLVIILFYFPFSPFIGRHWMVRQAVFFALLLVLWRYAFSAVALPQRLQQKVLIVGAGKAGSQILEALRRRHNSGLAVIGYVDDDPQKQSTKHQGLPVLGNSSQLSEIVGQYKVNLVVLAITHGKSRALTNALTRLCLNGAQLIDMPSLYEFLTGKVPIDHISDLWLLSKAMHNHKFYYRQAKRLLDLGMALLGLALTWPLFGIIALAIRLDSAGTVFYRQERLGQDSRPFEIIKFRTMVQNAEKYGPQWASSADPRITRVGRILRKLRLDELPQLINILKGEMSLIGPRPEREVFVRQFQQPLMKGRNEGPSAAPGNCTNRYEYTEQIPFYNYRLMVKPGVTGWAQVMYPYSSSLEQTREKLQYDLYYIKNMGFSLDLAILLKSVRIVLCGRGM